MTDDAAAWLRLTLCPGVGPAAQRSLLSALGPPASILSASRATLAGIVGREVADRLLDGPAPQMLDTALKWLGEPDNHILTLADADYPPALLEITDPPTLLYAKGDVSLLSRPALAIVGARSATAQGADNAEAFARALAEAGLVIVSGLALGIDTAAHRGALEVGGKTVAVIGTGADRVYPARNRALAHRIVEHGVIVGEFPLGTPPVAANFPRRNRIIAGLARGVLVVEAATNSGSLITARLAGENGREVLAIPGSIHAPMSRGCHRLIRDGARLVETAQDVLEELRWGNCAPQQNIRFAKPEPPDDPQSATVLDALGHDPVDIDTLVVRSGLTLDALYAILLALELDGHVAGLPGGRYQRL
jgi:DNA processing protein